ncbi:MAG: site-2 protease family protein [Planctomycetota bacterium]|nr:site-2 protease family protein [Planctomycetota bacterium]
MGEWSFKVGRIFGIQIRLHLFFVMGVVFILLRGHQNGDFTNALFWCFSLYVTVLLHELGHCWAGIRNGARAESILLWPLGGLATITGGRDTPGATIEIAAMGPAVNLILCILIGGGLMLAGSAPSLNPFAWPHSFADGLFRMNLVLLLFNLLPAYPLDGGRILQGVLAMFYGFSRSVLIATRVGQVASIILGVLAIAYKELLVAAIALYIFMTCGQERRRVKEGVLYSESEQIFGHDFSDGYRSLEAEEKPERKSWGQRRREQKLRRKAMQAAQEDSAMRQRVDDLLEKVGRDGIDSLTAKERSFLEEASRKFRSGSQR